MVKRSEMGRVVVGRASDHGQIINGETKQSSYIMARSFIYFVQKVLLRERDYEQE